MRKTTWVFGFVVVYILAAFGWWTLLLIQSNNNNYKQQKDLLTEKLHRAHHDVQASIQLGHFNKIKNDTVVLDPDLLVVFLAKNYPEFSFKEADLVTQSDFLTIKPAVLQALYADFQRKHWMFIGEGLVFISLLLWGIMLIFRSYGQKIKLNQQKTNFLLSITHELRSPLASAKLMLQTLQKRKLPEEQTQRILQSGVTEIDRLNDLLEKILLATKFDNDQQPINNRLAIAFSELCDKVLYKFELLYAGRYHFNHQIAQHLDVYGDEILLQSAVINLIENAIKYTPEGGNISLVLKKDQSQVVLAISDTGVGISDDEKPKIFEKFYRVGNEETRTTKGTGLGLYIVKTIVKQHLGRIIVTDNQPNGSIFTIYLPLAQA